MMNQYEKNVKSYKSIAKQYNDLAFQFYFKNLMMLALARFKWNDLPNNIESRWIERFLFFNGKCMFFKDDSFGEMVSKCTTEGVNYWDEPISATPVATGFSNVKSYKIGSECVLIGNDDLFTPLVQEIEFFAYKLASCDRTIDVNINAQKTPLVIVCSDKQRLSLKNIYVQYAGNEPVIYGDKALNLDNIKVLKTDAPIVFDKLQIQKHAIWNECMTFLGINNANQDKRERLVDDEVQANNEQVGFNLNVGLQARKSACELINKLFNANVSVSVANVSELAKRLENQIFDEEDGGDEE